MTHLGDVDIPCVGIVVIEEFLSLNQDRFIHAACPCQEFPQFVHARWKEPAKRPQTLSPEIPFLHCLVKSQEYAMHLFGFPEALSKDFSVEDLQFPMKLLELGFVVILDLEVLSRYDKSSWSAKFSNPRRSALAWALAHNLGSTVVVKAQDFSLCPTEELRSILKLNVDIPIHHCSDFDAVLVQQILSSFLGQLVHTKSNQPGRSRDA